MIENETQPTKTKLTLKHYVAFFMIGIAAALAIGMLDIYLRQDSSDVQSEVSSELMENTSELTLANAADDSTMLEPDGRYLVFTPRYLEEDNTNRRVLFFYTNGCPTCESAHTDLIENANDIPDDVTILRVNFDDTETDQTEKELAQKYDVKAQHTFVQINAAGEAVTTWNGGELSKLLSNLE